jgi:hypothetical protein
MFRSIVEASSLTKSLSETLNTNLILISDKQTVNSTLTQVYGQPLR